VQAEAMATLPTPSFTKGPVPEITTAVWTIPCPPEPVSERVPPPLSRIVITELQTDAPEAGGDVDVFRKTAVAPFRVNDPPVDPAIRAELSMLSVPPELIMTVPVPTVIAEGVNRLTVPSSTVTPATVIPEFSVTLNEPIASVPAEKTAVSVVPLHTAVAEEPVESVLQVEPPEIFPLGVAPPAPGVAPLMSQYLLAAWTDPAQRATARTVAEQKFIFIGIQVFYMALTCTRVSAVSENRIFPYF